MGNKKEEIGSKAKEKEDKKNGNDEESKGTPMHLRYIILLAVYFVVLFFLLVHALFELWPHSITATEAVQDVQLFWGLLTLSITEEGRFILIVIFAGALGSYIHTTTSFVTYAGNRQLVTSWVLWYLLRPFIGSALALIFYCVVRGAFFSFSMDMQNPNIFSITALGSLVGMFSKEAVDKLDELFEGFFKRKEDVPRNNKLRTPETDSKIDSKTES